MRVKTLALVLMAVVVVWGVWTLGYNLGNPTDKFEGSDAAKAQDEAEEGFRSEANGPSHQRSSSVSFRRAAVSESLGGGRAIASEEERASPYSSIISKHHLEKEYRAMSKVFPNTTTGDALRYTATFYKFRSAIGTEEGQLVNELLELLKAHPTETYADLRQNISKMPSEYSTERQYLMQLVSNLEIEQASKVTFFTEELQRSSGPFKTSDPASYNGMIALRSLLNETPQSTDIEPVLRDVLAHEKDIGARSILISTYERFAPVEAGKLRSEFISE